jgi:hypothetical protein
LAPPRAETPRGSVKPSGTPFKTYSANHALDLLTVMG